MVDYFEESRKRQESNDELSAASEKEAAQFRMDFKKCLQSPEMLRVFYRILEFSGVWMSPMKTSSEIYYRTGMADVGREILNNIQELGPEAYLEIMKIKFEKELKEKT